mgnify:CR=1 FL=1
MSPLPADLRLILAHKQNTSGRLRFLRLPHGTVAFSPLPARTELREDATATVTHHPAAYLRAAEDTLRLPAGSLAPEPEFQAVVDTPGGPIEVRLASFTTTDPPFEQARALGGEFVAITEAAGAPTLERELLRMAYTAMLG